MGKQELNVFIFEMLILLDSCSSSVENSWPGTYICCESVYRYIWGLKSECEDLRCVSIKKTSEWIT